MDMSAAPAVQTLVDRLRECADLWAMAAPRGSLPRLGRLVMNDTGFFSRIESTGTTTTATLERFAQFLSDPDNWPDAAVPEEICTFAHVVGVTSAACRASPDTNPAGIAIPVSETERGTPEGSPATGSSGRAPAAVNEPPTAAGDALTGEAA